jgi:hypothetical protein
VRKAKAKPPVGSESANPATRAWNHDWSQTYPVIVTDDTASPRCRPGDTVHVHPGSPVYDGDWVLIVQKAPTNSASPVSVIARLVARDKRVVILQRLNPAGVYTLPAHTVLSIHRIVGSSEAGT